MIRNCSTHDSKLFDSWFDPVRLMILPCSTHDSTLFHSWFDPVRLMIRPCSTHDSTLFHSWFDPVRLMIRHCSTHGSTLFDSWLDPVRLIIRTCSTSRFDPVRLLIRPWSTYDSTLFDSWFDPVRLIIRFHSTRHLVLNALSRMKNLIERSPLYFEWIEEISGVSNVPTKRKRFQLCSTQLTLKTLDDFAICCYITLMQAKKSDNNYITSALRDPCCDLRDPKLCCDPVRLMIRT